MSTTSDFKDPRTWQTLMGQRALIVHGDLDGAASPSSPSSFVFEDYGTNISFLKQSTADASNSIRADYLKWHKDKVVEMQLNPASEFFFTSHLTNCSFVVLDALAFAQQPLVLHTTGNLWDKTYDRLPKEGAMIKALIKQARFKTSGYLAEAGEYEHRPAIVGEKTNPPGNFKIPPRSTDIYKAWRFSKSLGAIHGYRGDLQSSAFIFGRKHGGKWKFYAQVTEGTASQGTSTPEHLEQNQVSSLKVLKQADGKYFFELPDMPTSGMYPTKELKQLEASRSTPQ